MRCRIDLASTIIVLWPIRSDHLHRSWPTGWESGTQRLTRIVCDFIETELQFASRSYFENNVSEKHTAFNGLMRLGDI